MPCWSGRNRAPNHSRNAGTSIASVPDNRKPHGRRMACSQNCRSTSRPGKTQIVAAEDLILFRSKPATSKASASADRNWRISIEASLSRSASHSTCGVLRVLARSGRLWHGFWGRQGRMRMNFSQWIRQVHRWLAIIVHADGGRQFRRHRRAGDAAGVDHLLAAVAAVPADVHRALHVRAALCR